MELVKLSEKVYIDVDEIQTILDESEDGHYVVVKFKN